MELTLNIGRTVDEDEQASMKYGETIMQLAPVLRA